MLFFFLVIILVISHLKPIFVSINDVKNVDKYDA